MSRSTSLLMLLHSDDLVTLYDDFFDCSISALFPLQFQQHVCGALSSLSVFSLEDSDEKSYILLEAQFDQCGTCSGSPKARLLMMFTAYMHMRMRSS